MVTVAPSARAGAVTPRNPVPLPKPKRTGFGHVLVTTTSSVQTTPAAQVSRRARPASSPELKTTAPVRTADTSRGSASGPRIPARALAQRKESVVGLDVGRYVAGAAVGPRE